LPICCAWHNISATVPPVKLNCVMKIALFPHFQHHLLFSVRSCHTESYSFNVLLFTTPLRQLVEPWCRPALEPARQLGPQPTAAAEASVASPPTPRAPEATIPAAEANAVAPPPLPAGEATAPNGDRRTPRARRVRALNPLAAADAALLEAVSRHEFLINGLRNRDLRRLLYGGKAATPAEQRRQSAAVTRQLRLLRAYGLLHKVPKTHRYVVGEAARKALTALLAARNANADELIRSAG
jgi:hypothetical protein